MQMKIAALLAAIAMAGIGHETAADSRVEAGTRVLHVNLLSDDSDSPTDDAFVGSIDKLEASQDYLPLNPYVQALFPLDKGVSVGPGISFNRLFVDTVDEGGGDGTIESQGVLFYIIFAVDRFEHVTPYFELGYGIYDHSFDPTAEWSASGLRAFNLEGSSGGYVAGGCAIDIDDRWAIDLYLRYLDVETDGEYVFLGDDRRPEDFTFTLEHVAFGLGVQYTF